MHRCSDCGYEVGHDPTCRGNGTEARLRSTEARLKALQRATSSSREERQNLSRMLFEARERVEMTADVIEASGKQDAWGRQLVNDIDEYRAARGWSPHGFGDEE